MKVKGHGAQAPRVAGDASLATEGKHKKHDKHAKAETPVVESASPSATPLTGQAATPQAPAAGASPSLGFVVEEKDGKHDLLPPVKTLLHKYEQKDEAKRSYERVLTVLAKVDSFIGTETDPNKLVDNMLTNDLRRTVFLLQGQMRLYGDLIGPQGKDLEAKAKALEDALGNTLLYQGLMKTAEEKGASPKVKAYFAGQLDLTRKALTDLVAAHWTPDPAKGGQIDAVDDFLKVMSDVDWPGYNKDAEYLADQIRAHVETTSEKSFDMTDMANGIHALRRALRWTHLFYEAAGGLVQLDANKNPVPEFTALLDAEVAKSKFMTLPDPAREKDPVKLSKSIYVANLDAMLKLGALKDRGEPVDHFAEAMLAVGEAKDVADSRTKAAAFLGAAETADGVVHAEARAIYDGIKQSGLFEAQMDELEAVSKARAKDH